MNVQFDPASWDQGAQLMSSEVGQFTSSAQATVAETAATGAGPSATDAALVAALHNVQTQTSGAVEAIRSQGEDESGRMRMTAANYRAQEERAVSLAAQVGHGAP